MNGVNSSSLSPEQVTFELRIESEHRLTRLHSQTNHPIPTLAPGGTKVGVIYQCGARLSPQHKKQTTVRAVGKDWPTIKFVLSKRIEQAQILDV